MEWYHVILIAHSLALCAVSVRGSSHFNPCQVISSGGATSYGDIVIVKDVLENSTIGTVIANITMVGRPDEIHLRTTASKSGSRITFDIRTKQLRVVAPLWIVTYPDDATLKLDIKCLIKANNYSIIIPVTVLIKDQNNNRPLFSDTAYNITLSEYTSIGYVLPLNIDATDLDIKNLIITYSLKETRYSNLFSMNTRGEIRTAHLLDYERTPNITLVVIATDYHQDNRGRHLTSEVTLTIRVQDEDDQNPVFSSLGYYTVVEYDAKPGSILNVTAVAHDPDTFNSSIKYSLLNYNGTKSDYFDINPENGVLKVVSSKYNLRAGEVLGLMVKATQTDNSDRYSSAILRVDVSTGNQPHFRLNRMSVGVEENRLVPSIVAVAEAVNVEKSSVLRYSIDFSEPPGSTQLSINEYTGEVSLISELDYEVSREVTLHLKLSDGLYSDTMVLLVSVVDVNDCRPQFSNLDHRKIEVTWSHRKKHIATLQATDCDENTTLTYSLLPTSRYLEIDETSGQLYLLSTLPPIGDSLISTAVVVTDNGHPQPLLVISEVTVHLSDIPLAIASKNDNQGIATVFILASVIVLLIVFGLLFAGIVYKRFFAHRETIIKSCSFEGRVDLDNGGFHDYSSVDGEVVIVSGSGQDACGQTDQIFRPHSSDYSEFGRTAVQENPFKTSSIVEEPKFSDVMTPKFMNSSDVIYTTSDTSERCSSLDASDTSMIQRMSLDTSHRTSTLKENSFGKSVNQYLPRTDEIYVNPSTMTIYY